MSHVNQNKCYYFRHEGQFKYDFIMSDLLWLGAYLASLPDVLSETSFHYLWRSNACDPICNRLSLREDLFSWWKVN